MIRNRKIISTALTLKATTGAHQDVGRQSDPDVSSCGKFDRRLGMECLLTDFSSTR